MEIKNDLVVLGDTTPKYVVRLSEAEINTIITMFSYCARSMPSHPLKEKFKEHYKPTMRSVMLKIQAVLDENN